VGDTDGFYERAVRRWSVTQVLEVSVEFAA